MACNPILTAEGYLKGVMRLKPRPLTNMFATSMQRSIDGNEDIGYFIDLMYTMLEYDPSKRPDIKELLKHPFFIEPEIVSSSD
jgi:serine/threonine protein kinase